MTPKRIVIIDDCRLTLAIARDILEEAGFEVETAETGIEANAYIYGGDRPDLLLIDVVMPMLNGDRKVRLLKAGEKTGQIPVLLMSHKTEAELQRLCRESGAEGYLAKPLRPEPLLAAVNRLLASTDRTPEVC